MEEDKAAALYESLSRQGLGAARFKQGLGFGAGTGAAGPETATAPIAFKKAGADFSTEIEEAEKQPREEEEDHRKEEDDHRLSVRRNAYESARVVRSIADKLSGRSSRRYGNGGERRRLDSDSEEEQNLLRSFRRGRSSDSERERYRRKRSKGPAEREDERRREESPSHNESSDEDRAREKRIAERRKKEKRDDRKSSRSKTREDGRGNHQETRSGDHQRSRGDSSRGRHVDTGGRSRSRSRERNTRGVNDRGSDRPNGRGREDERRSERDARAHRREEPLERSRDREPRRHGERSSRRVRSRSGGRDGAGKDKVKDQAMDYAEVIRGYENMSAAEKLKAHTKYALSQTVRKDSAKGLSTEWERYDFDVAAPLDEDAQQDMYGDDTKAGDDAAHLLNTGSSFGIAKSQAVREAEKQAAHDAAIFGLPIERSNDAVPGTSPPEKAPVFVPGDSEEDEEDRPVIVEAEPQAEPQQPEANPVEPARPAGLSWKERALKAQQARREAARATDASGPG